MKVKRITALVLILVLVATGTTVFARGVTYYGNTFTSPGAPYSGTVSGSSGKMVATGTQHDISQAVKGRVKTEVTPISTYYVGASITVVYPGNVSDTLASDFKQISAYATLTVEADRDFSPLRDFYHRGDLYPDPPMTLHIEGYEFVAMQ